MNTIAADLDTITAGMSVTRYANDDEEFNYAVNQMEDLGHEREEVIKALTEWIENTPTWTCPNCDLEHIEEAGWPYCPRCDEPNPSVYLVSNGDDTGLANLAEAIPSTVATITREGNGSHRAGRVYHLQVNGKHFGTYETRRQAVDAARDAGAVI